MEYSERLVEQYKKTMLEEYGYEVTDEDAQIELNRLASLFITLPKIDKKHESN